MFTNALNIYKYLRWLYVGVSKYNENLIGSACSASNLAENPQNWRSFKLGLQELLLFGCTPHPYLPPVPDQDISILWTADPIKGKITQIFQILCKTKLILTFVGEFSGTSLNKGYQFLFDIERVKSLQNQSCMI